MIDIKFNMAMLILVLVACCGLVSSHRDFNHDFNDHSKPQKLALYRSGTVFYDPTTGEFTFKADIMDKDHGVAYGYFNSTLNVTGWGVLEITAQCPKSKPIAGNASCSDDNAMYAAGLLEGILTAEQIWQNYLNIRPFYLDSNNSTMEMLYRWFFKTQDSWTRKQIESGSANSYWNVVSFVMSQFDGLVDGYQQAADPSWVTAGFENVFMSHSSWFVYAATMRIYKHYHFNLKHPDVTVKSLSFSSYPGFLESLDDFYLLDNGLVLLQTTNNVFNTELYDQITPASLFAWQRVRVACAVSINGYNWYETFMQYNSGTYNNQYMILDLNKIQLNKGIDDFALMVVEQIPGVVYGIDETDILRRGYWASYNVPAIQSIYDMSGYPEMVKKHGTDFSYLLCPRAKIFRRDAGQVETFQDMMDIMRYNNYKNDTYSEGNACNSICCRGDLVTDKDMLSQEHVSGCYDTKLSDYYMARKLQSVAINGPTTSHNLPSFSWTGKFAKESHIGLPTEYKFGWQEMKPIQ